MNVLVTFELQSRSRDMFRCFIYASDWLVVEQSRNIRVKLKTAEENVDKNEFMQYKTLLSSKINFKLCKILWRIQSSLVDCVKVNNFLFYSNPVFGRHSTMPKWTKRKVAVLNAQIALLKKLEKRC